MMLEVTSKKYGSVICVCMRVEINIQPPMISVRMTEQIHMLNIEPSYLGVTLSIMYFACPFKQIKELLNYLYIGCMWF
jgi:hypothetical protein